MHASKLAAKKYKKVCKDFPNLAILTKSAKPDEVQLTFGHRTVGNNSLGESVVVFDLAGYLDSPSVFYTKTDIAFYADINKICLPITEFFLHAAVGDLVLSKKQLYWTLRNAVLLPPLLAETAILNRESDAGKLLKIFLSPSRSGRRKGKTLAGTTTTTAKVAWWQRTRRRRRKMRQSSTPLRR